MAAMASQITSLAIVYSTIYSGTDQRLWPLLGEFTGDFPAQRASNAENVSVWWRHHVSGLGMVCDKERHFAGSSMQSSMQSFWNQTPAPEPSDDWPQSNLRVFGFFIVFIS